MSFWDKIQGDLKKNLKESIEIFKEGSSVFTEKIEELTGEGKKQYQVFNLNMKVQEEFAKLGGAIYDLTINKSKNPLSDTKVKSIMAKINKMEGRITKLEDEKDNMPAPEPTKKRTTTKKATTKKAASKTTSKAKLKTKTATQKTGSKNPKKIIGHFLFSITAIPFLMAMLFYGNSFETTAIAKAIEPEAKLNEISWIVRSKDTLGAIFTKHNVETTTIAKAVEPVEKFNKISGIVRSKDTLNAIFTKHNLKKADMSRIVTSAKKVYNLSNLSIGNVYSFELDKEDNKLVKMRYGIDDNSFLDITRDDEGFSTEKVNVEITRKIGSISFNIKDNLFQSMPGTHKEYHRLTLKLAEIYAWDTDFSSDIRTGDSVKMLVEELWAGEAFKGFGEILAVEFTTNGKTHYAYRFESNGYEDYYDAKGRSLRKALLRSPLKFKYISSGFTNRRYHPILRIYRPHLGIDYAAPTGTPVSAAGNGTVVFAGYKGQNGKMVRIKHNGIYETYYGHLSRIPRKIRKGAKVSQGDIIGYVGTTGLSTGPHLDYRMKRNGEFVNPLKISLPKGKSIPTELIGGFVKQVLILNARLAALAKPVVASYGNMKTSG